MSWLKAVWHTAPAYGKAGIVGCGIVTLAVWFFGFCAGIFALLGSNVQPTPAPVVVVVTPIVQVVTAQIPLPTATASQILASLDLPSPSPISSPTSPVVTKSPSPVSTETLPPPSSTVSTEVVGTAKDNVNVRSGPGTDYQVVGSLKKGEQITIQGRSTDNQWVQYVRGWVNALFLDLRGDLNRIEVVVVAPAPTIPPIPSPTPPTVLVIPSPIATLIAPPQPVGRTCCKICTKGIPCGNTCIAANKVCHVGPGCAC